MTYKAGDYYETVKAGLDAGKTVVMTTQVENEGSDLAVYHVGAGIKRNLPILEAYDMTSEAVTAKLMWILGQTTDTVGRGCRNSSIRRWRAISWRGSDPTLSGKLKAIFYPAAAHHGLSIDMQ